MLTEKDLHLTPTDQSDLFALNDPAIMGNLLQAYAKSNETRIMPSAGKVIKTKIDSSKNEKLKKDVKVFINLTHSMHVPPPPLVDDDELVQILNGTKEPGDYKVPVSTSNHREDQDKKGNPCYVWDTCIFTETYNKTLNDELFHGFILELCLSWIETKNNITLSRDVAFPKMKQKGTLSEHVIFRAKRPFIQETKANIDPISSSKPVESVKKAQSTDNVNYADIKLPRPTLKLAKLMKKGILDSFNIKVELPLINNVKDLIVDIEKEKVFVFVPNVTFAEIKLPQPINLDLGEAVFDHATKTLDIQLFV